MDSEKFDDLIKSLGTTRVNRMTALKGLAGGALAAVAGVAIATGDAEAGKRGRKTGRKKKSRRNQYVAPAPTYGTAPVVKPAPQPEPEQPKCYEPEYGYCDAYDAAWDDKTCGCDCGNGRDWCTAGSYKDTCVSTDCGEYETYNTTTCKCDKVCKPKTCNDFDNKCGTYDDGCNGTIDCGSPKTCDELGKKCGSWDDHCGGTIDCGDCKGKEYYDRSYCDTDGKCACEEYTEADCKELLKRDAYHSQCSSYYYDGNIDVDNGCGGKLTCSCSYAKS